MIATSLGVLLTLLAAETPDRAEITVRSDDTRVRIAAGDDHLQIVSLTSPVASCEWIAGENAVGSIPLLGQVEVAGRALPIHWRYRGQQSEPGRGETVLRFTCDDPPLELQSVWHAFPGPGPVEHEIRIVNRGKETVQLPLQPTLAFAVRARAVHPLTRWWVERGGSRPSEIGTHHDAIVPGQNNCLVSTPYGGPIPWLCVDDAGGHGGWYAGIEFSGLVQLALKTDAGPADAAHTVRALFGLGRGDKADAAYRTRLAASETFTTPTVFFGCYAGGVDDGANRLRRWVEKHIRPQSKANLPLLTNNSWGDGMAVDETMARRMIDQSAELGMEMFHIDAGWYRHVGDWRTDPGKFPSGMAAMSDYAHGKGLLFGLWIAWTQGGDAADKSGRMGVMSVRDPAMRPWFPDDYAPAWRNSDFTGATVCLGEPRAAQWCLDDVRRAVRDYKLDLLEHDQAMIVDRCQRDKHRHTTSPIDVACQAALGYYRVQDGLRESFPQLLFENCCNGGNLVDYGVLRRTHYVSITDTYDPLSNRRAFFDSSYALPPAMCECYVENRPGKTPANFRYMLRSGLMGWCTIMTDMARWSPAQRAAAREEFANYKRTLRPFIQTADLYHVSARPDGRRWDGIEYYDPQRGCGVLFAFRGTTATERHAFKLQGLDRAAQYHLTFHDATRPAAVVAGKELLDAGVELMLPEPESSELVYVTLCKETNPPRKEHGSNAEE